jgi:hypothetical protein
MEQDLPLDMTGGAPQKPALGAHFSILVLPRLKCRQGERAREDAGNAVRSVHMIGVGDGRGTCHSCKPRTRQRKVYYFTQTIRVPLRTTQAEAKRANAKK